MSTPPMTTNSGQEHAGEGVHPRAALIEYLVRYGGRCRDCADEAGFCPTTGIGCGQRQRAAEHFVGALEYGIKHGFVTTPETARIAALEAENAKMRERSLRAGVYTASKTVHAPKWRGLRDAGMPIHSTWIDEAGVGETADFSDLWRRCIQEAATAEVVLLYREPGEVLKGAFIEAGAALASGVPVLTVGCEEFSFVSHALVRQFPTLPDALEAARAILGEQP